MSVINNLLKDLDSQPALKREQPTITLLNIKKTSSLNKNKWIIAGSAVLTVALCFYVATKFKHPTATITAPLPITAAPAPTAVEAPIAVIKPSLVTGVTLQVKDNVTELTLLLDKNTLYRLNSDSVDGQYSLILENTQFMSELPASNNLNTAIEHITTKNIQGDTQINLTLFPGANIKYVNLDEKKSNPELVIAIEYNKVQAQPSSAVKTPILQNELAEQYQTALNAADASDFQTAIENLMGIIKMDAKYKEARVTLVALLLDQGNKSLAKQYLDQGLLFNPEYPPLVELKARMLTEQGKIIPALNLLQSISPPINENPDYHALMAALYQRSNNNMLAVNIYNQLIGINPHNGRWWFGLGVSLDKMGKGKDAYVAFTKAVTEGHLNTESLIYLRNRLQALQEDSNDSHTSV